MEYPLNESAWRRGWNDTKKVWTSWMFFVLDAVVGVVIGGIFEWYWGAGVVAFGMLCAWLGVTLSAPCRQRNEARLRIKELETAVGANPDSPVVAKAELHFADIKYHFISSKPLVLGVEFMVSATGKMLLESLEIEISGNRESCKDWQSYQIGFAGWTTSFGKACEITGDLSPGEHRTRLLIFANEVWWASDWTTIKYDPSSLAK